MIVFQDSRLEDSSSLEQADYLLRPLAEAGARLRRESLQVEDSMNQVVAELLPRAVIAFGPESRLIRAVLEPTCPVPFVAWPRLGLPPWVGPLDLVVTMGSANPVSLAAAAEAVRRGSRILVACPTDTELAQLAASRDTTLLPTCADPLTNAVIVLAALRRMGVGPQVDLEAVADAMDLVASECAASLDIANNPAKAIALELAEAAPLVWGGSILAARASRRIAEELRAASGRVVLSADAEALIPLLGEATPPDLFADPFETTAELRPGLVILNDGFSDERAERQQGMLNAEARVRLLRVSQIECLVGDRVTRYVTLLHQGLFAAQYLRIGLDRLAVFPT